jgi:hypothetical protein
MANPMNIFLAEGEGGALFAWRGPGIYEVHVALEQRGKAAFETMHRMLDHMRECFAARLFWSVVPLKSRKVIMFARRMGWKSGGTAEFPHGVCEIFIKDETCPHF